MSKNYQKFLEELSKSKELVDQANAAKDANALVALAKELGIELTAADFEDSCELSDDELDAVAGGDDDVDCVCAMGGGGEKDHNDKVCACVMAGVGHRADGAERCLCGFAGWGYETY